jgi:hypothetical protein
LQQNYLQKNRKPNFGPIIIATQKKVLQKLIKGGKTNAIWN